MKPNDLPPGFIKFWAAYPRKVGKGHAAKAWVKNGCEPIADEIIKALKKYPFSEETQFQPHASTWLNGWRWLDEQTDSVRGELDGW